MNILEFLSGFNVQIDAHADDDEACAFARDHAEGALRAGVRLTLDEYKRMTADLRASWIEAGNRIMRDGARAHAPTRTERDEVSAWADELSAAIFGEAG